MPRERVHHGKIYADIPTPGGPAPTERIEYTREVANGPVPLPASAIFHSENSLDVSWNIEGGWVQISMEIERDKIIASADDMRRDGDTISRAFFTDVLSRKEINHMIRTLRRARDKAYEPDE